MFKSLTAAITAVSLCLAVATPVQAQGLTRDDTGKLIFGVAVIAALAAIANNNNKPERAPTTTQAGRNLFGQETRGNSWADLNRNSRSDRRNLPRICLQGIETRFGTQRMFTRDCLEREYRHVNGLPDRCAVRVFSNNHPRSGFDPQCLRDAGYRSDRRQ